MSLDTWLSTRNRGVDSLTTYSISHPLGTGITAHYGIREKNLTHLDKEQQIALVLSIFVAHPRLVLTENTAKLTASTIIETAISLGMTVTEEEKPRIYEVMGETPLLTDNRSK